MKLILTSILIILTFSLAAQEEKSYSVELGITASTFSGTETSINKLGLLGGVSYTWFNNPSFGGEVGLQFIQKGAFNPPDRENGSNHFYKLTENYIHIPFSALFQRGGITYMLGLSAGYLLSFKEENESGTFPISEPFRKYEIALTGGVKISLTDNLKFKASLHQSLIPVKLYSVRGLRWYNRGHYNTSLSLGLLYQF